MVLLSIHQNQQDNSGKKHENPHLKDSHRGHSGHGKYSLAELDKFLGVPHLGLRQKKKGPHRFSYDKSKGLSTSDINPEDRYRHSPESKGEENGDGDIEMIDLDSEEGVNSVTNYLSQERRFAPLPPADSSIQVQSYENRNEAPLEVDLRRCIAFVVDTNFIISHLGTLESIRTFHSGAHHMVVIPRYTMRELDGLKNSDKPVDETGTETIGKLARAANDWVYRNLASSNSNVVGQRVRQVLDPSCIMDDAILDCCLYFKERMEMFAILLSNDKNLCSKALTEDIPTVSYVKGMTGDLITQRAYDEYLLRYGRLPDVASGAMQSEFSLPIMDPTQDANSDRSGMFPPSPPDLLQLPAVSSYILNEAQRLLINATNSIMFHEYDEDLEYIGFDPDKMKSLRDVSECIYKYWISVFCEYFRGSKIRKDDWKSLPESLLLAPSDKSDLSAFVRFWGDVLEHLYAKRSDEDNKELEYQLGEWSRLAEKCN